MRTPNDSLKEEYSRLVNSGFDWKLRILTGPSAPKSTIDGKKVLMLCSNNYLNLTNHPKLKEGSYPSDSNAWSRSRVCESDSRQYGFAHGT